MGGRLCQGGSKVVRREVQATGTADARAVRARPCSRGLVLPAGGLVGTEETENELSGTWGSMVSATPVGRRCHPSWLVAHHGNTQWVSLCRILFVLELRFNCTCSEDGAGCPGCM